MLWLQSPEWGRRLAAIAIILVALFVEFRPTTTAGHPFVTSDVKSGTEIGEWNTEVRDIPRGLLNPVDLPAIAAQPIAEGEPVLDSSLATDDEVVPDGWWTIEVDLPRTAQRGANARLVFATTGEWVDAVVVAAQGDDQFGAARGEVAVNADSAAAVATAISAGSVVVVIETD